MKKVFCFALSILLALSFFTACDQKEPGQTANDNDPEDSASSTSGNNDVKVDTYLQMAQALIDSGDYDGAINILQKGLNETGDSAISLLLSQTIAKKEENTESDNKDNAEGNGDNNQSIVLTKDQMIKDLIACKENTFFLDYQDRELDNKSISEIKRTGDDGLVDVEIRVQWADDKYGVDSEYILYYSYLEEDGWWLYDYKRTSYDSYAIASRYSDQEFSETMQYHFNNVEITNREQTKDGHKLSSERIEFCATLEFPYLNIEFNGWCTLNFADDMWLENSDVTVSKYDFSKMYGTWEYVHDNGDYVSYTLEAVDIYHIDEDDKYIAEDDAMVRFSYATSAWKWLSGYSANNMPFTLNSTTKSTGALWVFTDKIWVYGKEICIPAKIQCSISFGYSIDKDGSHNYSNLGCIFFDYSDGVHTWFENGYGYASTTEFYEEMIKVA